MKIVVKNKNAYRNYEIEEKFEAGMTLLGTEIKSMREGRMSLKESYCRFKDGELYLVGSNITPYSHADYFNHEPQRDRKLLLHKSELRKLQSKVKLKGFTIVPIKVYFNKKGLAKIEIGIGKGKKLHDKREDMKQKAIKREMEKEMKYKF